MVGHTFCKASFGIDIVVVFGGIGNMRETWPNSLRGDSRDE